MTFVRPVAEEHKLAMIEELSYNELRPEFRQTVKDFLSIVNSNLKPKLVNGKGISGKMFVQLAESYISAFNADGCPEILPCLERVIAHEVNKISKEKIKVYGDALAAKLKEMSAIRDPKELIVIYNALITKLELDLWTNASKRMNYDLYWLPREKINRELRDIFTRHLDELSEKRKAHLQVIKTKFAQNLVPPKRIALESYFSVNRMKEFHKGMIGWLDKALDNGSLVSVRHEDSG